MSIPKDLIDAALDQRHPSPELRDALQAYLTLVRHLARDASRDRKAA